MEDKRPSVIEKKEQEINWNVRRDYAAHKACIKLNPTKNDKPSQELANETMQQAIKENDDFLQSLGVDNTLAAMLAVEMDAVHDLQQHHFLIARLSENQKGMEFHVNTVIKLSNVFVQQAALMQKLLGKGQQKVTVEHVHVHNGGQAIVGNVGGLEGRGTKNGE